MLWLIVLFIMLYFMFPNKEHYTPINKCKCINCGICKTNNHKCVSGNMYGPYTNKCSNYIHSSLLQDWYPYYNNRYKQ